jgi:hypothetical protein
MRGSGGLITFDQNQGYIAGRHLLKLIGNGQDMVGLLPVRPGDG